MKRFACLIVFVAVLLSITGCGKTKKQNTDDNASKKAENITVAPKEIENLINENTYCLTKIFSVLPLDYEYEDIDGYHLVIDEKFKTFADLENYTKTVYTKETADELLNKKDYNGKPIYKNIGGRLYINVKRFGGKSYNVDWSEPVVKIIKSDENECEFSVTVKSAEPGENVESTDYTVVSKAVKVDGNWLLTEMIH